MTRQGAAIPSLAPGDAHWGRFLGPFRNGCSGTVPNIPVPRRRACNNPNARVRAHTLHYRPPDTTQTTLPFASQSFYSWIRGFSAGLSGRDPVLERSHCDLVAIPLSAYGGRL
jgi:hypothetical protein